ncbi:UNVERIFIED_CONTAM: hypothetical protein PYX00_010615 [Menopon gallinae]|uniref:SLC41A/MgtE integral membrane domain-containing protein n=2 Tax=Menopon gallinae TaxID=328185 RepID=A0AAW2HG14_9NEOP
MAFKLGVTGLVKSWTCYGSCRKEKNTKNRPSAEAQVMGPQDETKEITKLPNSTKQPYITSASPLPDVVVKVDPAASGSHAEQETFLSIGLQVLLPFLVAGMGMVGAGIYLDHVQSWPVFQNVSEIIILVPSLLGLKGNLEMTLASRLSTEANLGHMDDSKERWIMILGNLILVQCQAIVVGLLSSVVAVVMVAALRQQFNLTHTLMLCACSLITASVASLILGVITAAVISLSRFLNINPDNVATPIAASLGDITSLALLSWIASLLYESIGYWWISPTVMVFYILSIPFWFWITKNNRYTQSVLYTGWTPVVVAMVISTLGGFILDLMVSTYRGLAVFQPVINGVGGNLVSVQSSRLSTELHKETNLGTLPPDAKIMINPISAFCSKKTYALTARVLMSLVVPGHLVFIYTISWVQRGEVILTPAFITSYLIVSLIQVAILLYMSCILTHYFWSRKIDPDNSTIPYLTAVGDLLGIILLGICFKFLSILGDEQTTAN